MTATLSKPSRSRPADARPADAKPAEETRAAAATTVVAGVVDTAGGGLRLRLADYLPGPDDPTIPTELARRHGLRRGDTVTGVVGDGQRRRLTRLDTVNGLPPELLAARPDFADLVPVHPSRRLRLETTRGQLVTRVIDLIAPIGRGQRGLIVAPPKAGKTLVLRAIAEGITRNHPECRLMVLLLDERPEEVTELSRAVAAEVISSPFDRPAADHIAVAALAVERAKRLVELGQDVVILLDSLTRLCRAHNNAGRASGRILSGGVDAAALHLPKRLFGAARAIEGGGSLTILATALTDTGSRADDFYFEELKSTGNMEFRLDRTLAERRVYPAVDLEPSGTRREELLLSPAELDAVRRLRRALLDRDPRQGAEQLLERLRDTASNAEFLTRVSRTVPA
ncbi:transcription termination factor Rho [Streptomyces sp. 8K308]|uniref:transcription termination factor Rho n=1 Tax=Streptomyces sp. 8K308 TaxID=2530388 RepID=UPI00104BF301|nr:transcription termination factor Rho [Streptomyces sp. 8K308]TDC24009.1 transcription termination factor Rho [Streptomyces sp. 8K308]